jgi:carboxymethylenebutenolidase
MAGGEGFDGVHEFYTKSFISTLPPDTETTLISRTVGHNQIVDELIFKFTHTTKMDWMLPGIEPTGERVEVALVAIVGFEEGKISHEHIYWDQASVLVQLGLIKKDNLPIHGIESVQKIQDCIRRD